MWREWGFLWNWPRNLDSLHRMMKYWSGEGPLKEKTEHFPSFLMSIYEVPKVIKELIETLQNQTSDGNFKTIFILIAP